MRRTVPGMLFCWSACRLLTAAPPDEPASALAAITRSTSGPAATQLVLRGLDQAVRLELETLVGGQPWDRYFQSVQANYLQALYAYLDADSNGSLSADEAGRLMPPKIRTPEPIGGEVYVAFNFRVLDNDGDEAASFAEVESYLTAQGDAALHFTRVNADVLPDLVFRELDADGDRVLTDTEAGQMDRLRQHDRDGNQVVTLEELRGRTVGPSPPEFVASLKDSPRGQPALRVEELSPAAAEERLPPGIHVRIDLNEAGASGQPPRLSLKLESAAEELGWRVDRSQPNETVLKNGNRLVVLKLLPSAATGNQERESLLREFATLASADGGGGKLTSATVMSPELRALFLLSDRNADDAVDEQELRDCLDRVGSTLSQAKAGQLRAIIFPEQAGLIPLVDFNRDGRLSRREVQAIPNVLQPFMTENKTLHAANLPLTTVIVLQRGPFAMMDAKDVLRLGGPTWFTRADRNGDGDLDRDEFPGSPEDYGQLDRNQDGWIELQEALQFEIRTPKSPQEAMP